MIDIDKVLSSVLQSDGSFAEILAISGLDPAQDLKGCDFSFVDFGDLSANKIDLSHCNLFNADLRKVRGRLILNGAQCAGAKFPSSDKATTSKSRLKLRARFDLIKQAALQAHRFQLRYKISDQIRDGLDWNTPVVAFYRSPGEREILQDAIKSELSRFTIEKTDAGRFQKFGGSRAKFIEVRASSARSSKQKPNRAVADAMFFRSLLGSSSEAVVDITIKPGSLAKIVDHTSYGNSLNSNLFAKFGLVGGKGADVQGRRDAFTLFMEQQTRNTLTVLFFNNTGLFSADLFAQLRKNRIDCYLVFLLERNSSPDMMPTARKSDIWPEYVHVKPRVMLDHQDISIFVETFKPFEKAGLFISEDTRQELAAFYGRPVGELKRLFMNKLTSILTDRRYDPEKVTVI